MKNDVKTLFSNRVENYVKYRPSYPLSVIDFLTSLGLSENCDVADIGSGTGILSELLVNSVNCLYAVEPNKEMRSAAEKILGKYKNYFSVDASAEETALKNNSVDFITVAQAFHWFNRDSALSEFRRILKKSGKLVLIWHNRINNTPFLQGYEDLLLKYGTDYREINHQNLTDKELENCFVKDYKKTVFDNFQKFDLEGIKGRLFSSSYTPSPGETGYDELVTGIEELYKKYNVNGYIMFNYNTEMFSGSI